MIKGGKREGAGRPKGSMGSAGLPARPARSNMRAYDDEWELIKAFEKIVKKGDKESAREFVLKHACQ